MKKRRKRRPKRFCECGNRKPPLAEACERCMELDGATLGEAAVISGLRMLGGSGTTDALQTAMGTTRRHVLRAILPLVDTGRVRKIKSEPGEGDEPTVLELVEAPTVKLSTGQLVFPARNLAQWVRLCGCSECDQVMKRSGGLLALRCSSCLSVYPAEAE